MMDLALDFAAHQAEHELEHTPGATRMEKLRNSIRPHPMVARLFGGGGSPPPSSATPPGRLMAMTYDPMNANVLALQRQHGAGWKRQLAAQNGIAENQITERPRVMNKTALDIITKIAGAPAADQHDARSARIMSDLIKGAGAVQVDRDYSAETKLAAAGVTPVDIAHMVGSLQALDAAGFSKKEAAEYLQVPESTIDDVLSIVLSEPQ